MRSLIGTRDFAIAIVFALIATGSGSAQSTCSKVTIPLLVAFQPDLGLTAQDFSAKISGHPANIASLSAVDAMPRVVVVIDPSISRTYSYGPSLTTNLIKSIPSEDLVAIVVSTDAPQVIKGPNGASTLSEFLSAKPGSTQGPIDLWQGIRAARKIFDLPTREDSVFVITDGGDKPPERKALMPEIPEFRGIRLFAFILNPPRISSAKMLGAAELRYVAMQTGGSTETLEFPGKSDGFSKRADALLTSMRRYYLVTLVPEQWDDKATVDLRPNGANHALKGATLNYPRELRSCDSR